MANGLLFKDSNGGRWRLTFHKTSGVVMAHRLPGGDGNHLAAIGMTIAVDPRVLEEWKTYDASQMASASVYHGGKNLNTILTGGRA